MNPEYHGQIGEVPVGKTYKSVTIEEGTVSVWDIVVWEDPDAPFHDEKITTSLFVGFVKRIYKRDEPELGTSCPLGRIAIDQHVKALSGKEIHLNRDGASMKFVDRFLSSQYEIYMNIEWTRNGDFRVSGE